MAVLNVHQTTLANEGAYIFITNVRISTLDFVQPDIAHRIHRFVSQEYTNEIEVYFEITAAYTLVHRDTGAQRKWVGSFSPQQDFALTPLLPFSRETFFPVIEPLLHLNHLSRQIEQLVPNSVWVLHEVEAMIVNISGVVPRNYPRLTQRGLLSQHGNFRKVKSFELP